MPIYTELLSEVHRFPDSMAERLMVTKMDVQREIDYLFNSIHRLSNNVFFSSTKYYSILENLIGNFRSKLRATVLPNRLEEWWRYTYELSYKGACLYLEHINTVWVEDGTGEADQETVDQVFTLISCEARMLTVEDYSKLYGVEPVTVRQWIRRGKLKEAEKIGKEWRISELADVNSKASNDYAAYKWIVQLKEIPEEFAFLSDYTSIDIKKRELIAGDEEPEKNYFARLSSRADKYNYKYMNLSGAEKHRLEACLIASPDVQYTSKTRYYDFKHEEDEIEEDDIDDDEIEDDEIEE